MKWKKYERELVKILISKGFKARRIPASKLDVIATKNDSLYVFEVKFTKEKKVKIKKKQIENLFDWLNFFDYYKNKFAFVAVKFKYKDWIFKKVDLKKDYEVRIDDKSEWIWENL